MHRVHLYDLDITDVKLFDCATLCTCSTCLGWVRSGFAVKKLGLVGLGRRDSGLAPANWTHVNLRFVYGTGQGCAENRKQCLHRRFNQIFSASLFHAICLIETILSLTDSLLHVRVNSYDLYLQCLITQPDQEQEAQLSPRDRAMRHVS